MACPKQGRIGQLFWPSSDLARRVHYALSFAIHSNYTSAAHQSCRSSQLKVTNFGARRGNGINERAQFTTKAEVNFPDACLIKRPVLKPKNTKREVQVKDKRARVLMTRRACESCPGVSAARCNCVSARALIIEHGSKCGGAL